MRDGGTKALYQKVLPKLPCCPRQPHVLAASNAQGNASRAHLSRTGDQCSPIESRILPLDRYREGHLVSDVPATFLPWPC